jgi:hypothetical protein
MEDRKITYTGHKSEEKDIEETLESLTTRQICIQSALINADIHVHVRERLQNDRELRK